MLKLRNEKKDQMTIYEAIFSKELLIPLQKLQKTWITPPGKEDFVI